MFEKNVKLLLWPLIIYLGVIILDQITKIWAVANLTGQPPLAVIGNFLQFTLVYNEGGAMGTRLGPSGYYLVMALIVLPFLMIYIYRTRTNRALCWPLTFVAAGATGNIIDRIRIGRVVDFIDVDFFDINLLGVVLNRWWTFNIADAAISCAIVFMLVHLFILRGEIGLAPTPADRPTDSPTE